MNVQKFTYVYFFANKDPAIKIAVQNGKYVNAKFCKGKVLYKLKKYTQQK
jgi:hypothetical protein